MASALAVTSLIMAFIMAASTATAAPSSSAVSSDITIMAQEMQRARYFTFVMLLRMVQDKIPHNTTFLMPNDRLMSTASIPQSQVLEFLFRHSISAPLMYNDLIRLPNGTVVPTHHSSEMITVTNTGHQKLYFNDVELTSPDLCNLEASFRCHGINGVIRPTATRRGKGATCTRYVAPTSAPPDTPSAANQSLGTSPLPSPNTGSSIPAQQPAAESPQSSDTPIAQIGMTCTTLMTVLMFSIF